MKKDIYTKVVLTIIAVCLVVLVLKDVNIVSKVNANPNISDKNVNYGLVPLNEDGSINVRISPSSEIIDVNIKQVGGYKTYSYLRVKQN